MNILLRLTAPRNTKKPERAESMGVGAGGIIADVAPTPPTPTFMRELKPRGTKYRERGRERERRCWLV